MSDVNPAVVPEAPKIGPLLQPMPGFPREELRPDIVPVIQVPLFRFRLHADGPTIELDLWEMYEALIPINERHVDAETKTYKGLGQYRDFADWLATKGVPVSNSLARVLWNEAWLEIEAAKKKENEAFASMSN